MMVTHTDIVRAYGVGKPSIYTTHLHHWWGAGPITRVTREDGQWSGTAHQSPLSLSLSLSLSLPLSLPPFLALPLSLSRKLAKYAGGIVCVCEVGGGRITYRNVVLTEDVAFGAGADCRAGGFEIETNTFLPFSDRPAIIMSHHNSATRTST